MYSFSQVVWSAAGLSLAQSDQARKFSLLASDIPLLQSERSNLPSLAKNPAEQLENQHKVSMASTTTPTGPQKDKLKEEKDHWTAQVCLYSHIHSWNIASLL